VIYDRIWALSKLKPNATWSWSGTDYSGLDWQDSGTAPTEAEIDAEVTRLNNAEPMRLLRLERNERLTETDYMALSDTTMTDAWKTYRQQLRDLPASADPKLDAQGNLDLSSVTFPTKPT
jgi:hypothetical protein|tara:strand:- start:450 stop:809 length:360 start_codon:yes stop_codon:yes gene_type:complete